MKKIILLLGFLSLTAVLIPNSVFSESDDSISFRAKGVITGEHFRDGVVWTSIDGNRATMIAQWSLGRSLIHTEVLPILDCESNYLICLEATVTDSKNSAAAEPGDKFIIKIDPENKKQIIVGKSGFLGDTEIILDLSKIYKSSEIQKTSVSEDPYHTG